MSESYTHSAYDRIVGDLIYSELQYGLADNIITLSPPMAIEHPDHNTKVTATVHDNGKLVNCLVSFYNREFLYAVLDSVGVFNMDISGYATTHELLPDLFTQFGILIEPVDVLLEELVENGYALNAAPDSYGWLGTYDFNRLLILRTNDEQLVQANGFYITITPGTITPQ